MLQTFFFSVDQEFKLDRSSRVGLRHRAGDTIYVCGILRSELTSWLIFLAKFANSRDLQPNSPRREAHLEKYSAVLIDASACQLRRTHVQ